ncbi:hypothetical protein DASC09_009310 [Saccharomycopsis crataegensis]|uniref:Cyclin-like domain-containing protein n=1 Tax=Saccharomycopsis crataegensis TaxID=43959 RepID=A0AAV5QFU9_9ASCO|nr:hypothetical protein DASC09_009310 [Saccharomycopsis crataegensis]
MTQNDLSNRLNEDVQATYKADIVEYFATLEKSNKIVDPLLIDLQTELKWFVRPYLLDFIIHLHLQLSLNPKTLHTAIQIMDQYFSKRVVKKVHYQLIVLTSLWISSKIHDDKSKVFSLKEIMITCGNSYDIALVLKTELHILSTLDWNIHHPTIDDCLEICFANFKPSKQMETLASLLGELSLYERNMMFFSSSTKAIASMLMAATILGDRSYIDSFKYDLVKKNLSSTNTNGEYNIPFVEHFTHSSLGNIRKVSVLMLDSLINNQSKSLKFKYGSTKYQLFQKIDGLISSFNDFLLFNKLQPSSTVDSISKDMAKHNQSKTNIRKCQLRDFLPSFNNFNNFPMMISNFMLSIEVNPICMVKDLSSLSLEFLSSPMVVPASLASPHLTPISTSSPMANISSSSLVSVASSPCTSAFSSRSNSSVSFYSSADDSSISEVSTPPPSVGISSNEHHRPVMISNGINGSDFFESPNGNAGVQTMKFPLQPKILDYNKKLPNQNVDIIRERKRLFGGEGEDEGIRRSNSKRQSPNMRENYSFYFK